MNTPFYRFEYSEKEIRLIKFFGLDDLITRVSAPQIYDLCMKQAFIGTMEGPEIDSIRRIVRELSNCTTYRGTAAFDSLIQFTE